MRFGLFIMGTASGSCQDILDQISHAEELGFDAVFLAERHFRHADLLCPSPFVLAAAVAARTERIRIGTAASILPLHHPLRIAEKAATLDILSGGRLDFGVTRASLDPHCHTVFHSPRHEAGGRFEEALEVITRAWTQDCFSYEGRYYQLRETSGLPRPVQQPHPPIYVVATTPETAVFAARKGYAAFVPAICPLPELQAVSAAYWRAFQGAGDQRPPPGLAVNRFVYVADTDTRARQEIRLPFLTFVRERAPDLKRALLARYQTDADHCFDRFVEDFCLFGAPASIRARLKELETSLGLTYLLCSLNLITLDHGLCVRSMELFAHEVMPLFTASAAEACV